MSHANPAGGRGPNTMPRPLPRLFGWSLAALVVLAPLAYKSYREQCYRNFHVVREGVLYRSGQLNLAGFQRVVREYGIRTVINLRDGDSAADQVEEAYCQRIGINFHRMPPLAWSATDGSVPAQANVDRFRALLADQKNWPILVHCFAGNHRTGALCAICRIDMDGWSNEQALQEMRTLGYTTIDGDLDLLHYLTTYRPRPLRLPAPVRPVSQSNK